MSFKNKVAIVTGASSGIGAVIAKELAKVGAQVTIVGRNIVKLKKVENEINKKSELAHIVVADISNEEEAKTVVDKTIGKFGKLNILINNAGMNITTDIFDENAISAFDTVMNTNLRSVVVLTHYAVSHLKKTQGNIVNISSIASTIPMKKYFAYCASKSALDHFSRCMALTLGEHGIRVNTVNPGLVKTDFMANMGLSDDITSYAYKKISAEAPLRRVCESEEVADIVIFLTSDKAKGVTGSSYVVDNGQVLASVA